VLSFLADLVRIALEWIKRLPLPGGSKQDAERVQQLEDEATRERRARLREIDARAANSRSRTDADELLRSTTADDRTVN
jgi:hypothetical protein